MQVGTAPDSRIVEAIRPFTAPGEPLAVQDAVLTGPKTALTRRSAAGEQAGLRVRGFEPGAPAVQRLWRTVAAAGAPAPSADRAAGVALRRRGSGATRISPLGPESPRWMLRTLAQTARGRRIAARGGGRGALRNCERRDRWTTVAVDGDRRVAGPHRRDPDRAGDAGGRADREPVRRGCGAGRCLQRARAIWPSGRGVLRTTRRDARGLVPPGGADRRRGVAVASRAPMHAGCGRWRWRCSHSSSGSGERPCPQLSRCAMPPDAAGGPAGHGLPRTLSSGACACSMRVRASAFGILAGAVAFTPFRFTGATRTVCVPDRSRRRCGGCRRAGVAAATAPERVDPRGARRAGAAREPQRGLHRARTARRRPDPSPWVRRRVVDAAAAILAPGRAAAIVPLGRDLVWLALAAAVAAALIAIAPIARTRIAAALSGSAPAPSRSRRFRRAPGLDDGHAACLHRSRRRGA